jgi:hypothetical protein
MNIWLIITACIHNRHGKIDPEKRKNEYIESITKSLRVVPKDVRVIIVENSCEDSSYLDQFGIVFYTKNGSMEVPSKAVIEFKDIQDTIKHFSIPGNDVIVKLTGRYTLESGAIFNIIRSSGLFYSAWVKFYNVMTKTFDDYDCILGCYAIRVRDLMKLDPNTIGASTYSMETDFAVFLRKSVRSKIRELQTVGVTYRFFESEFTVTV